jgi:undecaprenyl-diphosphatase
MQATLDPIQAIVLAIVQGLSEFLPISSSGHLVLVPHFFGWPDQGLAFDVAVHVGTLFAVVTYFRRELLAMTRAFFGSLAGRGLTPDARLAWCVLLGTIPVGLVGLAFGGLIEEKLRNPVAVATMLSFFGALMWLADRFGRRERNEYSVGWRDAILIGSAQALALMPGTSRSGITMTMARTLGLTREGAARFSFLLAVPGIAMAGAYEGLKVATDASLAVDWSMVGLGVAVAAVTGYLCIAWLLRVINRIGLAPFAIYRFLVAGLLFWIFA